MNKKLLSTLIAGVTLAMTAATTAATIATRIPATTTVTATATTMRTADIRTVPWSCTSVRMWCKDLCMSSSRCITASRNRIWA